ncbi:MAG: hypothetical protein HRU11_01335 [Parvularculaceae bacterium]|nr:hypothetical protein [Parvularculaceae bacterium]
MKYLMSAAAVAALVLTTPASAQLSAHVNMKNVNQQMVRIDTNETASVWIGGGRSDAARIVGQEFADVTGGSRIHFNHKKNELVALLAGMLHSRSNAAPEMEGVELVSLTANGFTIAFDGWEGTQNFVEFSGIKAEEAIAAATSQANGNNAVNFKNSASQMSILDSGQGVTNIFSGDSGALDPEPKALVGGSRIDIGELEDIFRAKVDKNGLEGVELIGLTDEGVAFRMNGQSATVDTIVYTGPMASAQPFGLLDIARNSFIDTKDNDTEFAIFDVEAKKNQFVGSDGSDTDEFREFGDGSSITRAEVLELFSAMITGNGRREIPGVDGVKLIGLNKTSFGVKITNTRGAEDYLLFTNVDTLEGAAELGFMVDVDLD